MDRGARSEAGDTREASLSLEVRDALPETYRADLDAVLASAPNPDAWRAEIQARMSGMHPPAVSPQAMGLALRDFRGNGASARPSLRRFRRYIAGAVEQLADGGARGAPSAGASRGDRNPALATAIGAERVAREEAERDEQAGE